MITLQQAKKLVEGIGSTWEFIENTDPYQYDDSLEFVFKGYHCDAQVSPRTGVVVCWNRYVRDRKTGDFIASYTYNSLAEMIASLP